MTDHPSQAAASVQVFDEFQGRVDEEWIASIAGIVSEVCEAGSERVSVVIADDDTVTELNTNHRGLAETTDVLSFAYTHSGAYYGDAPKEGGDPLDAEFILPPMEDAGLGEVIISYPQAVRQAEQAGHDVSQELAILLAHGVAHLLGYDHEQDEEAAEMQALVDEAVDRMRKTGLLSQSGEEHGAGND